MVRRSSISPHAYDSASYDGPIHNVWYVSAADKAMRSVGWLDLEQSNLMVGLDLSSRIDLDDMIPVLSIAVGDARRAWWPELAQRSLILCREC